MNPSPADLTTILFEASNGNRDAIKNIFPIVYNELRKIASNYLNKEFGNRTVGTNELVHEAYLKILGTNNISIQNRAHFFGIAANAMRQLLVDFARKRNSGKRGGGNQNKITLVEGVAILDDDDMRIVEIDNALNKLQEVDERLSRIVELRFFSGLTIEETAAALNCSIATIKREWSLAKAWLFNELSD